MNKKEISGESRMERKKEAIKQKIIVSAMKLFKKPGFDVTTMEQIAEKVDIAKGTLYNYFPAKEAIIYEYILRAFQEKKDERREHLHRMPDIRTRLLFIFSEQLHQLETNKEIFAKYVSHRMQNIASFKQEEREEDGVRALITETITYGQQNYEIRQDLPVYILADLIEFAFFTAVKQFYLDPEMFNSHETIDKCVDTFINGARQKPRRKSRKGPVSTSEIRNIELVWSPESENGDSGNDK